MQYFNLSGEATDLGLTATSTDLGLNTSTNLGLNSEPVLDLGLSSTNLGLNTSEGSSDIDVQWVDNIQSVELVCHEVNTTPDTQANSLGLGRQLDISNTLKSLKEALTTEGYDSLAGIIANVEDIYNNGL